MTPLYPLIAIPLRDVQCTDPVGRCRFCGGELYPFDPILRRAGGLCCPACAAAGALAQEVKTDP